MYQQYLFLHEYHIGQLRFVIWRKNSNYNLVNERSYGLKFHGKATGSHAKG